MTYKNKLTRIRKRRVFWLRKIKTSVGCEMCGYNESPLALDFAHTNPLDKHIAMVSRRGGNGIDNLYNRICTLDKKKNTFYIKELFSEIRKCKILCKNCHVIETNKNNEFNGKKLSEERGGSYKNRASGLPIEKCGDLQEFFVDSF